MQASLIYSASLSSKYILSYHLLFSKSFYAEYRDDIDVSYIALTRLFDWLGIEKHNQNCTEFQLAQVVHPLTLRMMEVFRDSPFQLKRKLSLIYFLDRYLTLKDWKLLCQLTSSIQD